MAKVVPIEQIVADRELRPDDDLSDLAKDLQDQGQQIPILTDADYKVIDGLRRLEALKSLGATHVSVTATSMYPVGCDLIKRAREHGVAAIPLDPDRIFEISVAMKPLLYATVNHYKIGRKKGVGSKASAGGRELLAKSLGLPSTAPLQAIGQVRYAAQDPTTEKGKRAVEAIAMQKRGELTIYGAVNYMMSKPGLSGTIKKYQEQVATLDAAINSLRGTMRALQALGPLDKKFPAGEADAMFRELVKLRAQFYKFVRTLNEEISKNV